MEQTPDLLQYLLDEYRKVPPKSETTTLDSLIADLREILQKNPPANFAYNVGLAGDLGLKLHDGQQVILCKAKDSAMSSQWDFMPVYGQDVAANIVPNVAIPMNITPKPGFNVPGNAS